MRDILIKVGNSESLCLAVQAALLQLRIFWENSGNAILPNLTQRFGDTALLIRASDRTMSGWRFGHFLSRVAASNAVIIDAATEMGKLIELLEKKGMIVENVVTDNATYASRHGTISPNGSKITIGCSTATYEKVKEVFEKMK